MTDRARSLARGAAVWLGILIGANLNGALRELALRPMLGPDVANAASTLLLCALVLLIARLAIRWISPPDAGSAWRIGLLWLVLTLAFEFLAGRYLFDNSWERILSEYDLTAGRLWILVPIVTLIAPRWAWGRAARGTGRAAGFVVALALAATACNESRDRAERVEIPARGTAGGDSVNWAVRLDDVVEPEEED